MSFGGEIIDTFERGEQKIPLIEEPDDLVYRNKAGEGTYNRIFNIDGQNFVYRISKYSTLVDHTLYGIPSLPVSFTDYKSSYLVSEGTIYIPPECIRFLKDNQLFKESTRTDTDNEYLVNQAISTANEQIDTLYGNKQIYDKAADHDDVIPTIEFNGLIKLGGNLHTIIKIEKYSKSLMDFYKLSDNQVSINEAAKKNVLRPIDYIICSQLLYINYKITQLGYLCTDVKPGNYVINIINKDTVDDRNTFDPYTFDPTKVNRVYELWKTYLDKWKTILDYSVTPDTVIPPSKDDFHNMLRDKKMGLTVDVDVRAIDLETDMCNKHLSQEPRGSDRKMAHKILKLESFVLQNLLLSSVCLTHMNWNILSCVFVDGSPGLFRDKLSTASHVILHSKKFMNVNFIDNTLHYLGDVPDGLDELQAFSVFLKEYLNDIKSNNTVHEDKVKEFINYYMKFAETLYTTRNSVNPFIPPPPPPATVGAADTGAAVADTGAADTAAAAAYTAAGTAGADTGAADTAAAADETADVDERISTEIQEKKMESNTEERIKAEYDKEEYKDVEGFFTRWKKYIKGFFPVSDTTELEGPHKKQRTGGSKSNNRTKKYKKKYNTKKQKRKYKKIYKTNKQKIKKQRKIKTRKRNSRK